MLSVRAYRHGDMDALGEPQAEQARQRAMMGDWRATAAVNVTSGPCWAIEWGGAVIALGGLALDHDDRGRARAWCVIGKDAPRAAWSGMVQFARRALARAPAMDVRRVYAVTAADWMQGRRLLELLGFELEGVARKFDRAGRDYSLWARVS